MHFGILPGLLGSLSGINGTSNAAAAQQQTNAINQAQQLGAMHQQGLLQGGPYITSTNGTLVLPPGVTSGTLQLSNGQQSWANAHVYNPFYGNYSPAYTDEQKDVEFEKHFKAHNIDNNKTVKNILNEEMVKIGNHYGYNLTQSLELWVELSVLRMLSSNEAYKKYKHDGGFNNKLDELLKG